MSSTGCPPSMPLMLMVACREPSGTTGIAVTRLCQRGPELVAHQIEKMRHALDGVDAEIRHAAVRDAALGDHLEPVDAAVADAHAIDAERLGNDDGLGPLARETPVLRQPRDAGEAAALFVDGAADLDRQRRWLTPARRIASAANTAAARPAFMSQEPRPYSLPSDDLRRQTDRASSRARRARRRSGR